MTIGVPTLKLRAATVGGMLRRWGGNCLSANRVRGPNHRLRLKDHLALCGVKIASPAPCHTASTKTDS